MSYTTRNFNLLGNKYLNKSSDNLVNKRRNWICIIEKEAVSNSKILQREKEFLNRRNTPRKNS